MLQRYTRAVRSALTLSPQALLGHLGRRARNRIVPKIAPLYRRSLSSGARRLGGDFVRSPEGIEQAGLITDFYESEYGVCVPGCFQGRFVIMNRELDFGSVRAIDWQVRADDGSRQLRRANLCQLGFLPVAMRSDAEATARMLADLLPGFERASDFSRQSDFSGIWHPYVASRRLQSLVCTYLLAPDQVLTGALLDRLLNQMRFTAQFVLKNLETELGYNHLERNLVSLALYALATKRTPGAISAALHKNFMQLVESIGSDGVQKERSATYHALTVQSLRTFLALSIWREDEARILGEKLTLAEVSMAALTLGDDLPVLFNDSWHGEGPVTSRYLKATPIGFHAMPEAGYVRLAAGPWAAVFDAGAIGPDSTAGHGHPDFLSIEASAGSTRLLVDPGTYHYESGARRDDLRAWTAHNGPAFLGAEPVAYVGSFMVGRRSAAVLDEARVEPDGRQVAAGHLSFDGLTVARRVELDADGVLRLTDRWTGTGRRRSRFLVPATWQMERLGARLILRNPELAIELTWTDADCEVGSGEFSPMYEVSQTCHEIILTPVPGSDKAVLTFRPI